MYPQCVSALETGQKKGNFGATYVTGVHAGDSDEGAGRAAAAVDDVDLATRNLHSARR